MDRISTVQFPCKGGLITNMDTLQQGIEAPGSALRLVNYEPALGGGYSRILGYTKYDEIVVPQTGNILGAFVFHDFVLACRGDGVYTSTGAGWTHINSGSPRTGALTYRGAHYDFMGEPRFVLVDSVNRPGRVNTSGVYSVLSTAPEGATCVAEFRGRLWFGKDNILTYSAPLDDTDYTTASGAGEINVSHEITGLRMFRDSLVVFCDTAILRITGDSEANFTVDPVSHGLGCLHPDSIVEANGDLYYCAADGIRTFAATERNDDFNLSNIAPQIQTNILDFFNRFERIVAFPIRKKNQIRFFGYTPTATTPSEGFVVVAPNFLDATFSRAQTSAFSTSEADATPTGISQVVGAGFIGAITNVGGRQQWEFSEVEGISINVASSDYTEDGIETIVFGNDSGYIYRAESGNTFDSASISSVFQTPYITLQDSNIRKSFRKLQIYFGDTIAYNMQVELTLDTNDSQKIQPAPIDLTYSDGGAFFYGTAVYGAATYGGGGSNTPKESVMLVGAGFNGSFTFTSSAILEPHTIKSLAIELSSYGRK